MNTEHNHIKNNMLEPLPGWLGSVVVIDLSGPFLCLGVLEAADFGFLTLSEADFHDLRDSKSTREAYVIDSKRVGIRRNRAKVLIKLSEVVAITKFDDID